MSKPYHTTRRVVLGTGAALTAFHGTGLYPWQARARAQAAPADKAEPAPVEVEFTVNGAPRTLSLDPRTTLLDALRDHLGLTGAKKGCDHGQCGACTVLVNGVRRNACLNLAVARAGDRIVTIEGLGHEGELHTMQAAFLSHDGFQCGFCTPGQICSAVGMLAEIKAGLPSAATPELTAAAMAVAEGEIRERMSGNLCRCAAYPNIVAAILEAAGKAAG